MSIKINVKMGLYGDSNVGKSTLIHYLQTNQFKKTKDITIGVDYYTQEYEVNNTTIKFQIWDTAGQERYNSIITKYYTVNVPIFMFDVSNIDSFYNIQKWIDKYQAHKRYDPTFLYCIGNKTDLGHVMQISSISKLCKDNNLIYEENSYINNYRIDTILDKISNKIYNLYKTNKLNIPNISIDNIVSFQGYSSIDEDNHHTNNYKKCCNI